MVVIGVEIEDRRESSAFGHQTLPAIITQD